VVLYTLVEAGCSALYSSGGRLWYCVLEWRQAVVLNTLVEVDCSTVYTLVEAGCGTVC
jgi:hypothetical protein